MPQLKMAKDQNRPPHTHPGNTQHMPKITTFQGEANQNYKKRLAAKVERCIARKNEVLSLDPQHPRKSQAWSPGLEWRGRGSLDILATQCSQLIQ